MLYNENLHEEEQHLIQQIAEQTVLSGKLIAAPNFKLKQTF